MRKASLVISFLLFACGIFAQNSADNIIVFKLYFKDKLVDSIKAQDFQILSGKGSTKERTGEPVDCRYESSCQGFVYSNYDEGSPSICIVHVIDTMEIQLPPFLVYIDKIPFQKGKFAIKAEGAANLSYLEKNNFKDQGHGGKKLPFAESIRFKNYSIFSWATAKVETPKK